MLGCTCCHQPVPQDQAKMFAEMFLCADCTAIAERLYARGEKEIRFLLLYLKESIRVAIMDGTLSFGDELEDKQDLVTFFAAMAAKARQAWLGNPVTIETTPLMETTSSDANILDATLKGELV